ncbi:alpha/beta hydrolase [Streptomyces sp. NPDC004629]|uniref:alpha/beta hydrolase n=1 Tax=Streptomyces sp. NPDC004629 TaxID=3364705 RepID=UPI0036C1D8C4
MTKMKLHPVLHLIIPVLTKRMTGVSEDTGPRRQAKPPETAFRRLVQRPPSDVTVTTEFVRRPDEDGSIEVRVYRPGTAPRSDGGRAALVYFHGGGWFQGSLETGHSHCAHLAKLADAVVVNVAYRLIPRHPYPANLRDCYTALTWVSEHAEQLGIDPSLVAVGGTSSGANLAAAVALLARAEGGPTIAHQVLEIPVLDIATRPHAPDDAPPWYPPMVRQAQQTFDRYIAADANPHDPLVSPLMADDLTGLPPTTILANELDVIVDHAVRYADRLRDDSVPVSLHIYPGLVHGTQAFTGVIPLGRRFRAQAGHALASLYDTRQLRTDS